MDGIPFYQDIAFLSLVIFFLFFFGLVFYLRREDRREGFPLADEYTGELEQTNAGLGVYVPEPKSFKLMHGRGEKQAPNFKDMTPPIQARRMGVSPGSPYEPSGDPMTSGVGPGAWTPRPEEPELDSEGHIKIRPMAKLPEFSIAPGDVDPRGFAMIGCDKEEAGKIVDMWVDIPEQLIRYYEIEVAGGGAASAAEAKSDNGEEGESLVDKLKPGNGGGGAKRVLIPATMVSVRKKAQKIETNAIRADQFANVPRTAKDDQITLNEEEKIAAYYGAGYLYATEQRQEPLI